MDPYKITGEIILLSIVRGRSDKTRKQPSEWAPVLVIAMHEPLPGSLVILRPVFYVVELRCCVHGDSLRATTPFRPEVIILHHVLMLIIETIVAERACNQVRLQTDVRDVLSDALVEVAPVVRGIIRMALGNHIEKYSLWGDLLQLLVPGHVWVFLHEILQKEGYVWIWLESQLVREIDVIYGEAV